VDVDITKVRVKFQPPNPAYPAAARSARLQGTVVVELIVGLDGVPISARALEGPFMLRGPSEAWAITWRFFPHLENGVPQVSRYRLIIPYKLT
jgi:protein TonB